MPIKYDKYVGCANYLTCINGWYANIYTTQDLAAISAVARNPVHR